MIIRDDELETFVYWLKLHYPKYTLSLKHIILKGEHWVDARLYDVWGAYYLPVVANDITNALRYIKTGLHNSSK